MNNKQPHNKAIKTILAHLNQDFYEGFPFNESDLIDIDVFNKNVEAILNSPQNNIAIIENDKPKMILVKPEFYLELLRAWNFVDDLQVEEIIKERVKNQNNNLS